MVLVSEVKRKRWVGLGGDDPKTEVAGLGSDDAAAAAAGAGRSCGCCCC